jgi:serine/threonine-protein kinase
MTQETDPFLWVGQIIDGKYAVERVVGEGGFGVVYRARHVTLGDAIAVKCLKIPPSFDAAARDRFRASFLEEGRLLRQLSRSTTGIVQALDAGDAISPSGAWTPYLILEWLEGEMLESWQVARAATGAGGMSVAEATGLLAPAARALGTAHAMGIAHRDVKPANLALSTLGGHRTLKVLDFGIAKVIADNSSLTSALAATGGSISAFTPLYGAPEQFNKRFGGTGPWTDVFSLALIFVELVTGKPALEGDDTTQLYVASTDPAVRPTLRARGAVISDAVEAVIAQALAVEPRERFRTADAMWDALEAAVSSPARAVASRPAISTPAPLPVLTPKQEPDVALAATALPAAPLERSKATSPMVWIAVGLAVTVAILVFIFTRPTPHKRDTERSPAAAARHP